MKCTLEAREFKLHSHRSWGKWRIIEKWEDEGVEQAILQARRLLDAIIISNPDMAYHDVHFFQWRVVCYIGILKSGLPKHTATVIQE